MKDYTVLDGQITCLRNKLYDEAYQRGYADGRENTVKEFKYEMSNARCYQRGLEDAWECARKIACIRTDAEWKEFFEFLDVKLFHPEDIFTRYTASEAMQKIKNYEERKTDEIKVGDEVKYIYEEPYTLGVVTYIDGIYVSVMWEDGSLSGAYKKSCFEKTGRYFPQIVEVVEQMRKESE